jgi:hypothetical protein
MCLVKSSGRLVPLALTLSSASTASTASTAAAAAPPTQRHPSARLSPEFRLLSLATLLSEGSPSASIISTGLEGVVPLEPLAVFTPAEVELACGGGSTLDTVDLAPLKLSAEYKKCKAGDALVQWLWEVLEGGEPADRRAFLVFVSEQTRLPTSRPLCVEIDGSLSLDSYPRSHTCFCKLELPGYTSKEQLKKKLWYAIYEAKTMEMD